jgi:hypothetical protein
MSKWCTKIAIVSEELLVQREREREIKKEGRKLFVSTKCFIHTHRYTVFISNRATLSFPARAVIDQSV